MNKRYAVLKDGKVLTVTNAPEDIGVNNGWIEVADTVATGDVYDGNTFSRPPVDVDAIRKGLRGEAMKRMRLCDWTQLPDGATGPVKAAWLQYRASLRALIQNPNIPVDTVVPDPPYSFDET